MGQRESLIEKKRRKIKIYQNLWDTDKVLRGKFVARVAYVKKEEKSAINNKLLPQQHREWRAKTNPNEKEGNKEQKLMKLTTGKNREKSMNKKFDSLKRSINFTNL